MDNRKSLKTEKAENLKKVPEIAEYLNLSPASVRDLLKKKEIPSFMIKGQYRVKPEDLKKYVDKSSTKK